MIIPFTDLFELYKETDNREIPNLTEERIYSFCQYLVDNFNKIPVFSGATQNKGIAGYVPYFFDEKNKEKEENKNEIKKNINGINYYHNKEGCITIVADGKAGFMFLRDRNKYPIFCMNISCIALFKMKEEKIKEKYPEFDGLLLEWFYLRFNNYFQNIINGEGVQHFTKTIYEKIDLEIPSKKEQEIELEEYKRLYTLKNKLGDTVNYISTTLDKHFSFNKKFETLDDESVSKIFDVVSGNSGLTEEYIYNIIDLKYESSRFKVLSSSTIDRTNMGEIVKRNLPNGKELKVFEDNDGLLVIRNGNAGKLYFLSEGKYTLNDHAYILYLTKEFKEKINLKWIIYQYQALFFEYSSASDNGTWNKTNFFKEVELKIIPKNEQDKIVSLYEELEKKKEKLNSIKNRIEKLFEKELVIPVK